MRSGASFREDPDRVLQGCHSQATSRRRDVRFPGLTFQPRRARNRQGKTFVSFLPAISAKAAKGIRQTVRAWWITSTRNNQRLEDLAKLIDPVVRKWMNYYGRYYRTKFIAVLHHINAALARWARRKYKRLRYRKNRLSTLAGTARPARPEPLVSMVDRYPTIGNLFADILRPIAE